MKNHFFSIASLSFPFLKKCGKLHTKRKIDEPRVIIPAACFNAINKAFHLLAELRFEIETGGFSTPSHLCI